MAIPQCVHCTTARKGLIKVQRRWVCADKEACAERTQAIQQVSVRIADYLRHWRRITGRRG